MMKVLAGRGRGKQVGESKQADLMVITLRKATTNSRTWKPSGIITQNHSDV